MEEAVNSILLGLVGGVAGWTLAQLMLKPRLRWASRVSRLESTSDLNGFTYRMKLKNASWFRSVDDISLQAQVYFTHSRGDGSAVGRSLRLGTGPPSMHRVGARSNRIVTIHVSEMSLKSLRLLGDSANYSDARAPERTLETLLDLPGAFLSVQIRAHDGWTGTAHSLESPRLRAADAEGPIFDGGFRVRRRWVDRMVFKMHQRRRAILDNPSFRRAFASLHPELTPGKVKGVPEPLLPTEPPATAAQEHSPKSDHL